MRRHVTTQPELSDYCGLSSHLAIHCKGQIRPRLFGWKAVKGRHFTRLLARSKLKRDAPERTLSLQSVATELWMQMVITLQPPDEKVRLEQHFAAQVSI